MNVKVVTASRVEETVRKSPTSVSVITAADIRSMGVHTIFDALASVSDIDIDYNNRGRPLIMIRGTRGEMVTKNVLVLLNGHPLNGIFSNGATGLGVSDLSVANIKHIEIVRGTGSALYGANAVVGVINIITKSPDDVSGAEMSFSTEFENEGNIGQNYNILFGRRFEKDIGVTFNLNLQGFNGPEQVIVADALGRPGLADNDYETVDFHGALEVLKLTISGRYFSQERGAFLGLTDA